jgi:hypothetical protein
VVAAVGGVNPLILPYPNADGTITMGGVTVPTWKAADFALRVAEACEATTQAQRTRRLAREHLDRLYATARTVAVRDMQTGAVGKGLALRWSDSRASVRVGDTVDAWLLRDGNRARGFLRQWYADELAAGGFVTVTIDPFTRVSVPWAGVARLRITEGR